MVEKTWVKLSNRPFRWPVVFIESDDGLADDADASVVFVAAEVSGSILTSDSLSIPSKLPNTRSFAGGAFRKMSTLFLASAAKPHEFDEPFINVDVADRKAFEAAISFCCCMTANFEFAGDACLLSLLKMPFDQPVVIGGGGAAVTVSTAGLLVDTSASLVDDEFDELDEFESSLLDVDESDELPSSSSLLEQDVEVSDKFASFICRLAGGGGGGGGRTTSLLCVETDNLSLIDVVEEPLPPTAMPRADIAGDTGDGGDTLITRSLLKAE